MDIFEKKQIAEKCIKKYKKEKGDKYINTLFVAIHSDDSVQESMDDSVLEMAEKFMLIHSYRELAVTNYYTWYDIDFVEDNGSVLRDQFDSNFRVYISFLGQYSCKVIYFVFDETDTTLYFESYPCEMQKIWNLYLKCKECKTEKEMQLLCELVKKDSEINVLKLDVEEQNFVKLFLEQQNKQYEQILAEIKRMFESTKNPVDKYGANSSVQNNAHQKQISLQMSKCCYIDLGLPSGTLWSIDFERDVDEIQYFSYCQVENLNIPTKEQWDELVEKCEWRYDNDDDVFMALGPNGNILTFAKTEYKSFKNSISFPNKAGTYFWLKNDNADNSAVIFHNGTTCDFFKSTREMFSGYKLPIRLVQ